ncbi:recombinase family protein [Desulfosporosinus sp. OT]|uniref:recombinase family protein n=1 Tax=Desulfosporosinus sp. OT TaxID=913865 RepID=UPI0002F28ACC|nr:recombinase family protein [Desulfosporosinus sp. OT]
MKNRIKKQDNRAWIYCRVAHPDDMALKFQQEQMAEYARKQDWEVVGMTAEQGSGLDFNRKGLKEVIEAVEAERVDIVLAKSVCRIGRDVYKTMECVEWMNQYGVKLITADNGEVNFKPANDTIGFMMTV